MLIIIVVFFVKKYYYNKPVLNKSTVVDELDEEMDEQEFIKIIKEMVGDSRDRYESKIRNAKTIKEMMDINRGWLL